MSAGTGSEPTRAVELLVQAPNARPRRGEPVTCGLPWPRGELFDPSQLHLEDQAGRPVWLQSQVLDRWSDGSARWVLLDWLADVTGQARYRVQLRASSDALVDSPLKVQNDHGLINVSTGAAEFQLTQRGDFTFRSALSNGIASAAVHFAVQDQSGQDFLARIERADIEERGPVRVCVYLRGKLVSTAAPSLGYFEAYLHFFAGSATVRFSLTIGNPRKAHHPGGLWDLGSRSSVFIRDAALTVKLPAGAGAMRILCSPESAAPFEQFATPLELYQDSSGGANWQSKVHINRNRTVPNSFRGYRLRAGDHERTALRATPCVVLEWGDDCIGVAMRQFWENSPKAIEATADTLVLRLFPRRYADLHELQGGEQKTHEFVVAFRSDSVTDEPLDWCRSPLRVRVPPEWYAAAGAVPYSTPYRRPHAPREVRHAERDDYDGSPLDAAYLALIDAAINGNDTFLHKREVIDEYGWRHFGEVYGDHEAVFHQGPTPLVSHYNNQYDPVAGFACQFLRSGDFRWWELMNDLAGHVADIDLYHTDLDKSAYNHGLFWHTVHYIDADTSTHRSYPRRGTVCGGGPGNEHNYTTGLMLHYFLTGSQRSRRAAIELAQWVLDMDDGRQTVFRWLDRGVTGLASATVSPLYHGPGRGAGNSLNALLDAYRLTGNPSFRAKLEQLLHRCIHPADDIAARNLLDPEYRWSYTMFLQALGRYLDDKIERGELDANYAYAQASLLHYARWMAQHEIPYLDRPERLLMPTETWAAQDMRKSDVFNYAAKHARGAERERFRERARFFFDYSVATLGKMKTRPLARPVIVLLGNGFMQAYFERHPDVSAPSPAVAADFGTPQQFVPQKVRAKRRLAMLVAIATVVVLSALALLLHRWLS